MKFLLPDCGSWGTFLESFGGHHPFNQNSDRSDREKWSTSKVDQFFFNRSIESWIQILVEWIAPGNFSGPKLNIQIKIWRIKARVLAEKPVHFVLLTDMIMFICKTIETSIFNQTTTAFRVSKLRDFRETGPWALESGTKLQSPPLHEVTAYSHLSLFKIQHKRSSGSRRRTRGPAPPFIF